MRTRLCTLFLASVCSLPFGAIAQGGPFDPSEWPATADPNSVVHYVSVDPTAFTPLGPNWLDSGMTILTGGDQITTPITIGCLPGLKVLGNYLNTADVNFSEWADDDTIDILMQVYGDSAVLSTAGAPRGYNFLTGVLPELAAPLGGTLPVEAKNGKWNWVLFRITNGTRPSDGTRFVGSIPANAQGGFQAGGVNGGTIRLEGVPNLIVRLMAFGQRGAFGEPEPINTFFPPEQCEAEPETNLVFDDINAGTSSHLSVLNNGDQLTENLTDVGPTGDKRKAVRALGSYMNFAIADNYLGLPCNETHAMKVCVEFYDDPALAGASFGPEAFATDSCGSVGFYPPDRQQLLQGSGVWMRRSWVVPAVNLFGVNAAPLTAGPRLVFETGRAVAISRFDLAVMRTGTHPLAGQDPLADCFEDPNICTGAYGNYVEMDLANGILNGLAPGTSGGDQEMIQADAGPLDDRRFAIRPARNDGNPAFQHIYLNFAIQSEALGPNSQPNAQLAICTTYYDDPTLVGARFRPEVYQSDVNGVVTFAFTSPALEVALEGTDKWRDAYFELPNVKFNGVNQGPQAAARFYVSDKVFFTRVRYAVIRPCGPTANVNLLAECKNPTLSLSTETAQLKLRWPLTYTGFRLEASDSLSLPNWAQVADPAVIDGTDFVITQPVTSPVFYRLRR